MAARVGVQTKLFGFNKKQVDEYFDKLHKNQLEKVELFKHALEDAYRKRELLYRELTQLLSQKEQLLVEKELLELALRRAKEAVATLQENTAKEEALIIEEAKQQKETNDKKIEELERDISNSKVYIDTLIENVTKLIKQQEAPNIEETVSGKVVGLIYPAHQKEKHNQEKSLGANKETRPDEKCEVAENEFKMTADGLILTDEPEENQNRRQFNAFLNNVSKVLTDSPANRVNETEAAVQQNSGFWDEKTLEETAATQIPLETDNGELTTQSADLNGSKGSPSITEEIINIRYKYIVGKIAGENLYDSKGDLIVAQNSVITAEIVDLVEKQGKLPELIVNMTIPGLEN